MVKPEWDDEDDNADDDDYGCFSIEDIYDPEDEWDLDDADNWDDEDDDYNHDRRGYDSDGLYPDVRDDDF